MPSPEKFIIRGGRLIDADRHTATPTDILVIGDSIAELGPTGMPAPSDARLLDASTRLLHPGFINAHTHGMGNLSKGTADRWSLELLWKPCPTSCAAESPFTTRRRTKARSQ